MAVFDATCGYFLDPKEVSRFIDHYFPDVKGMSVLDAGCRVGDYTSVFCNKGADVTGIDISEKCLEVAKKRVKDIRFGDIRDLEFKDNTFDIVFCSGTLIYVPPKEMVRALTEFQRVLKPNGTIFVTMQKSRGLIGDIVRYVVNKIPLKLYATLVENFYFLAKPLTKFFMGRAVNDDYLKYDVLLSIRDVTLGTPFHVSDECIVPTIETEMTNEKTTRCYKIRKDTQIVLLNP